MNHSPVRRSPFFAIGRMADPEVRAAVEYMRDYIQQYLDTLAQECAIPFELAFHQLGDGVSPFRLVFRRENAPKEERDKKGPTWVCDYAVFFIAKNQWERMPVGDTNMSISVLSALYEGCRDGSIGDRARELAQRMHDSISRAVTHALVESKR